VAGLGSPWQIDLSVEFSSVRQARQFAMSFAREFHLDGLSPDLALVTSELVSNAIRHARRAITLVLQKTDHEVQVRVSDDGAGQPVVIRPDPVTATGRGMQIVEGLSRRWGTTTGADGGKTVWAVLAEA
jgi:anti-sigma regulatory factor (Ser/Thr protein kinase)